MSDAEKWERLFRQGLAPTEEPEGTLNESIINRYEEAKTVKPVFKKKLSIGVLVAVCTLVLSITAVAATQLYSPKQVAEHLGETILAHAFESSDAVEINQSVVSHGYQITLHGLVSGAGLNDMDQASDEIHPDRTYAVVSIARQDGSHMPHTSDPEYGNEPFFISPLIKGQKPWQVNIASMRGGYSEVVLDGIMYRLIECDGVEMFADRGVYLAISSGSPFYSTKAFAYDESTGEVSPREDYAGIAILFDLPLDKGKADPVQAEIYLRQLLQAPSDAAGDDEQNLAEKMAKQKEELMSKLPDGTVIPESVREVTFDSEGKAHYEYDDWPASFVVDQVFREGQTGFSDRVTFSGDGTRYKALRFHRDENGVITGRVIELK